MFTKKSVAADIKGKSKKKSKGISPSDEELNEMMSETVKKSNMKKKSMFAKKHMMK